MTEDKWIKILEEEESRQQEYARSIEETKEKWRKLCLKNLPIFQSNIEKLNKILINYNCQFEMPNEIEHYTFSSSILNNFFIGLSETVSIRAILNEELIKYFSDASNMPMIENNEDELDFETKYYTDFDELIGDFIEAYKSELVNKKNEKKF